ncbi:MAG TPA: GatB/YqeY domain-containing protein [Longimicrobiales bacterium]
MAAELKERIRADLNAARRERDRLRTELLTTTLSDIRNREIELGHELSDEETIEVISRAIKRRQEAAEQMRAGKREELAEKEEREAALLSAYLPPPLDEAEVRALVREAIAGGAKSIGEVMGRIMPRIKGRFDGREANRIVREELG